MRIPILRFLTTSTCFVLSLVVAPAFSYAVSIVYDNTQTSLGWIANKGLGVEEGNTITLDGSANARVVTEFSVGYLPFTPAPGSEVVGTPTLDVRFYSNTNTLLYDSGLITTPLGAPDELQMQILTLDHLAVEVTDTFRWTAQFGGVTSAFSIPGGLFMFGPPTVGSFVSVYPGPAGILICPGAITDCSSSQTQSFYAQVEARPGSAPVPEPSSVLLLAVGLAGLAWSQWKRQGRAFP